jgi:hypothetical protein
MSSSPYRSGSPTQAIEAEDPVVAAYRKRRQTLASFAGGSFVLSLGLLFCVRLLTSPEWCIPVIVIVGIVGRVVFWRLDTRTQQAFDNALARERQLADATEVGPCDGAQGNLGQ